MYLDEDMGKIDLFILKIRAVTTRPHLLSVSLTLLFTALYSTHLPPFLPLPLPLPFPLPLCSQHGSTKAADAQWQPIARHVERRCIPADFQA